jgi:hypothetical protein
MTQGYQQFPSGVIESRKVVTSPLDFLQPIRSDVVYFIDGVIDFTGSGVSIEVPASGITLAGDGVNISSIICSDPNYTLFTSPVGGSGDIFIKDMSVSVSGASSQVYGVTDSDGSHAIELSTVNYNNCASLGEISGYRQGLENRTGRFGGDPSLTLSGAWSGGFRISTSIVRNIPASSVSPLFRAGSGFVMQNRFLTDINADLGANMSLLDFSAANFPNASTLQIDFAIIARNGVVNAADPTITPNIDASNLSSAWIGNIGLPNTYVGGRVGVSVEATTVISTAGVFVDVNGTFASSMLVHFDNPASSQLRHLGANPRDYKIDFDLVVDGDRNREVEIKIVKWDNSASQFVDVGSQRRTVNNLAGGRDVAFFNDTLPVTLDTNDYIKLQIANNTDTSNLTAEVDSFVLVSGR